MVPWLFGFYGSLVPLTCVDRPLVDAVQAFKYDSINPISASQEVIPKDRHILPTVMEFIASEALSVVRLTE